MIREACVGDAEQIADLVRQSFDERFHELLTYAQFGIGRFIALHIEFSNSRPERLYFVKTGQADKILGFAEFQIGVDGLAFLSYICVAPQERGAGVARSLIGNFLDNFSVVTRLELDVFSDNSGAMGLYKKLGFQYGSSIDWFVRGLPAGSPDSELTLLNAPEAFAMHDQFGFCRHTIAWAGSEFAIGRIGSRTIRTYNAQDFNNDVLLSQIRGLFPLTDRALLICEADSVGRPADEFIFNRSFRLVLDRTRTMGVKW